MRWGWVGLGVALGMLALPLSAQTPARNGALVAPQLQQVQQNSFQLNFGSVTPTSDRLNNDLSTLILRFNREIDTAAFDKLMTPLGAWLESVSVGYDSVLFRFKEPVDVQAAPGQITLTRATATALAPAVVAPATPAGSRSDLRLDLIETEIKSRSGDSAGAREDLLTLEKQTNGDPDVLKQLATVEQRLGGWNRAMGAYDRVLSKNPEDDSVEAERSRLYREYGPRLRQDFDWVNTSQQDQQYVSLTSGRWFPATGSELGFEFEWRKVMSYIPVTLATGITQNVNADRVRGNLYWAYDRGNGQQIKTTIFGQDDWPGASVAYRWRDTDVETTATAAVMQPFWEVLTGITNEGRVSYGDLTHNRNLFDRYPFSISGRLSQYGVSDMNNVGQSVAGKLAVRYPFRQWSWLQSAGYAIDTEYFHNVTQQTNSAGVLYQPLPLTQRFVNTVDIAIGDKAFKDQMRWDAFGGYSYDIINNHGPIAGLNLSWLPNDRFEMGARAAYSATGGVTTTGSPTPVFRTGAYMLWRF